MKKTNTICQVLPHSKEARNFGNRAMNLAVRHNRAVVSGKASSSIVGLIDAIHDYVESHQEQFCNPVGEDSYAGPEVIQLISAARNLLSMDLGELDPSVLDTALLRVAERAKIGEGEL